MRRKYLLDANHLGAAVNPGSRIRDRLRAEHRAGCVFGTCVLVIGEVEAGFQQTPDPERNRRALRAVREYVRLWPITEAIARLYGTLFNDLRSRGRVLSLTDMFLAALCRQMNLTLLTTDRDFEALPDIRTENWLAEPTTPSA